MIVKETWRVVLVLTSCGPWLHFPPRIGILDSFHTRNCIAIGHTCPSPPLRYFLFLKKFRLRFSHLHEGASSWRARTFQFSPSLIMKIGGFGERIMEGGGTRVISPCLKVMFWLSNAFKENRPHFSTNIGVPSKVWSIICTSDFPLNDHPPFPFYLLNKH